MTARALLPWAALAALSLAAALLIFHLTRETTLWLDEWTWALERRDNSVGAFLDPHNGHLSLVPVAVYKLLFATVGIDGSEPYRGVLIAVHVSLCTLVFVYVRARVGNALGLMAAALLMFLGPGWENILWPFQIGYLLSLASGVAAFLLLDRDDRPAELAAAGLLGVSLASSGIGVAVTLGLAIDVLLGRRGARGLWIVAAPVALYAVWWIPYQDTDPLGTLTEVPGYVAQAFAAVMGGLAGLGGNTPPRERGALLAWGGPLAVAAAGFLAWRVARGYRPPVRAYALAAIVVAFWALTEYSRGDFSTPYEPRYIYVGVLFVLLIAADLARGIEPSARLTVGLALVVAVITLSNVGVLRAAAELQRGNGRAAQAAAATARVAALPSDERYVLTSLPGYPYLRADVGETRSTIAALGAPGPGDPGALALSEEQRLAIDRDLAALAGIELAPAPGRESRAACLRLDPATPFKLPVGGVVLAARGAPAAVALRRYAQGFRPLGSIAGGAAARIRAPRDAAAAPWLLSVRPGPDGSVRACG